MHVVANRFLNRQRVFASRGGFGSRRGMAWTAETPLDADTSPVSSRRMAFLAKKKTVGPRVSAWRGPRNTHAVARRVLAIAEGASGLRAIQVKGVTDEELLADVLGSAHLPTP